MVLSLDRWVGKVAIVTGASSGIGAATAESLVEEGIINLSPGAVETPMLQEAIEAAHLDIMAQLQPKDIADGILYALSTPPHVQIQELTIKPVGEHI